VCGRQTTLLVFLSKLSSYPIFGFVVRRMNVVVDEENALATALGMRRAIRLCQDYKMSVMIFLKVVALPMELFIPFYRTWTAC